MLENGMLIIKKEFREERSRIVKKKRSQRKLILMLNIKIHGRRLLLMWLLRKENILVQRMSLDSRRLWLTRRLISLENFRVVAKKEVCFEKSI